MTGKLSVDLADVTRSIGSTPDARGLMPLAAAREILSATKEYTRDGPPSADVVWTALLSLADAAEFVREASRLEWTFPHLRGRDNEDAVTRWGAAALPWLETLLTRASGPLPSMPGFAYYFVGTHLLAIGPEAARAVLRVARELDADPDRLGFVKDWLARHGQPAWHALATRALEGDSDAHRALAVFARRSPSRVRAQLGVELATRVLGEAALATLDAQIVLDVLDAAASTATGDRVGWPTLVNSLGAFEYHAMRVVAVRGREGDDWGVLIEIVQGDMVDFEGEVRWPATIQQFTYGSNVSSGGVYLQTARPIPRSVVLDAMDDETIARLDLRPGKSTTGDVSEWPSVLALRAAVATDPDALFPPATDVAHVLAVQDAEVLLDVRALEHVEGHGYDAGALRKLPSESPSYRSIADVIATRDAARFDAGAPNTDWRVHATRDTPL